LPEKAPRVAGSPAKESGGSDPKAEIHIERWTAEERNLRVNSNEPVRVALRLLDYPAWRVEVNGKAVTPQARRDKWGDDPVAFRRKGAHYGSPCAYTR